jgi:hypothetical protein
MGIALFFVLLAAAQTPAGRQQCTPTSAAVCSEDQLLFLLSNAGINRFLPDSDSEGVQAEASRRIGTVKLLETLRGSRDNRQKEAIVLILLERDSKEVATTFASLLGKGVDRASCWIAEYLARRGDERALRVLNDNFREWEVSSLEWASVLRVFGQQHFYPATANLIESLDAASMNLGQAALETLMTLYPGAQPNDVATIAGAQVYFRARANSRR